MRPISRLWRLVWPHVPLAVVLILAGVVNLLTGLQAEGFLGQMAEAAPSEVRAQMSLADLGPGAQAVLGGALVLVGIGLLWRLRVAWTFALLLLLITVGVNVARGELGTALVLPGLVLVALLYFHRHFYRATLLASSIVSIVAIAAVLSYGTIGSFLLGEGFEPAIRDLGTGIYFSVVTLSTVGYGEIHPATPAAQIFVASLIAVGIGVFATAVVSLVGPALSNQLHRLISPRERRKEMRDHVILAGDGAIARNTAHELEKRGVPLVQIVGGESEIADEDRPIVRGEPSEDAVLREADIGTARMLIAAERDDAENAFISLAAKDLNPEVRVLAVASEPRWIRRLERSGADLVFAPAAVGSRLLAGLVEGEEIPQQFLDLLTGDEESIVG